MHEGWTNCTGLPILRVKTHQDRARGLAGGAAKPPANRHAMAPEHDEATARECFDGRAGAAQIRTRAWVVPG